MTVQTSTGNQCHPGLQLQPVPRPLVCRWHGPLFGRPFVKLFVLCYWTVVCLSVCPVLSVTLVHCGQTAGWINMKLGLKVGLGPGHIVLDGDPAAFPKGAQSPQFSAHVCCGQTAIWINMPLAMKVGISPVHIVLDGDPAPPLTKGAQPPFSSHVYCG